MVRKIRARRADSLIAKTKGMMFEKNIGTLYLETRWGIHTFFVRKSLLVFVMDRDFVVRKKKEMAPWELFLWNPKYYRVLEMPVDSESRKIKMGERVKIVFAS